MAAINQESQEYGKCMTAINITPMVDVMLVLLVIFMMSAPTLAQKSMQLELPQATQATQSDRITLRFYIEKSGKILLDRKELSDGKLSESISAAIRLDSQANALIAADGSLPHSQIIALIDQLKSLGLKKVGLAVAPQRARPGIGKAS